VITAPWTRTAFRRVAVVVALGLAAVVDLLVGASWPGRTAVFALGSSAVLVLGAKWLGSAFVSRPAGTRPGELGDPRDDLAAGVPANRAEVGDG